MARGKSIIDPETGLTPNEEAFCQARITHSLADAYRISQPIDSTRKLKPDALYNRASKMAAKPRVAIRIGALLDTKKIADLDNIGRYFIDLMRFIQKAENKENFTALAALMRLRGQAIGALKDSVTVNWEQTVTDDELIKRVSGQNPMLAKALAASLGAENKYAA